MITKASLVAAALATSVCSVGQAFVTHPAAPGALASRSTSTRRDGGVFTSASSRSLTLSTNSRRRRRFQHRMSQSIEIQDLCLTPQLERMTKAFKAAPNDKLRHVQLLEMAGMAPPIDPALKTEDNVVPGCLSRVYVAAEAKKGLIYYTVDSDSMLTKGLAAVLAEGLSGNTADAIQAVKPYFVKMAGLSTSLTPGRTNGFLNMLKVMKEKAKTLSEEAERQAEAGEWEEEVSKTPMADQIKSRLQALEPEYLTIEDESGGEESKFMILVVSKVFEGLNTLKRHRQVFGLLDAEMKIVHAVTLTTKTPEEVGM